MTPATADPPTWHFTAQAFRVDWTAGAPDDTPDLGRVPTISVFASATGDSAAEQNAIIYFRRDPTELAAPSQSGHTLYLNYPVTDFERLQDLLNGPGEIVCHFDKRGKRTWAGIRGPLKRRTP